MLESNTRMLTTWILKYYLVSNFTNYCFQITPYSMCRSMIMIASNQISTVKQNQLILGKMLCRLEALFTTKKDDHPQEIQTFVSPPLPQKEEPIKLETVRISESSDANTFLKERMGTVSQQISYILIKLASHNPKNGLCARLHF